MAIQIRLPTLLRGRAEGKSVVEVSGQNLGEVLGDLARQHPQFSGQVVSNEGELHKFINVYLNDDDVRFLGKLETPVKDGDTISLLPAVAGG